MFLLCCSRVTTMIRMHSRFQGGYSALSSLFNSVPQYLRPAIDRRAGVGFHFGNIPDAGVPPGVDLEWWNYVNFASESDEWVVTTGELEIRTPQPMSVIHPDVNPNEVGVPMPGGGLDTTLRSDAWGKVVPHGGWGIPRTGPMSAVSRMAGGTRPCGVIVVCNRAVGTLPAGLVAGPVVAGQLVYSFFHELALHAGTISYHLAGNPDQPIDHPGVDRLMRLLEQVIPRPVSSLPVVP